MPAKQIKLPCYGIVITVPEPHPTMPELILQAVTIRSDLREPDKDWFSEENREYKAAVDTIESLVLAHYHAGVDIEDPAYIEGIETAVEACANHLV